MPALLSCESEMLGVDRVNQDISKSEDPKKEGDHKYHCFQLLKSVRVLPNKDANSCYVGREVVLETMSVGKRGIRMLGLQARQ